MTHFQDGLRTGGAVYPPQPGAPQSPLPGAPSSPVYVYNVVPIASSNITLAASGLQNGTITLQAAGGITTTSINGVTYYDMGNERCIRAVSYGSGSIAVHLTASGLDDYYQVLTTTWSAPTNSTSFSDSPKPMRYVRGVSALGSTGSGVSLGPSDRFGFPYRVDDFNYIAAKWAQLSLTASTGFTAASSTYPATALTGPVRGTMLMPTVSADGSRRFTSFIYLADVDTNSGLYGVAQV